MARQKREWYPGAVYHVMSRGNRRLALFKDETLVTGTVKKMQQCYKNISRDFRYDRLTLTPCIC